jgi:hypothetical protein
LSVGLHHKKAKQGREGDGFEHRCKRLDNKISLFGCKSSNYYFDLAGGEMLQ